MPSPRREQAGEVGPVFQSRAACADPRVDEPLGLDARDAAWAKKKETGRTVLTLQQRLLLRDTWQRSGLSAGDFATLVGISKHRLYKWKQRFSQYGPEGLMDQRRGGGNRSNRLSEVTRRAIRMIKEANPEWGCQRISDMLARGPALPASASTVARVLEEAGYETVLENAGTVHETAGVARLSAAS